MAGLITPLAPASREEGGPGSEAAFLAACLEHLQAPDDPAAATRLVRHLIDRQVPLSDALHERLLRTQLRHEPYRLDLTETLVGLLLKSGRAPVPEVLPAGEGPPPIDDLAVAADSACHEVRSFAHLWQLVVRRPSDPRGWAEYARAFALRFNWPEARAAAARALASDRAFSPAAVKALLAALRLLAEQSQLGDLRWEPWFKALPDEAAGTADGAGLAVHTGRPEAPALVAAMLAGPAEDPVDEALVAGMAHYGRGDLPAAAMCFRRAFQADLPAALRRVVMTCSAQVPAAFGRAGMLDEVADWLEAATAAESGDILLMPASFAPDALAVARRQRQTALERGLPSPLLITQAKSGSVSVGSIFSSGFGLPTAVYSLASARVIPSWLAHYRRGGACYVTHLLPHDRNIEALIRNGAGIVVHVRDPRQAIVSNTEHRRRYGNQAEGFAGRSLPPEDEAAFDLMVEERLEPILAWIAGWVEASARLPVNFTTFEEFVTRRERFLERLLAAYGGDTRHFDRSAAFTEQPGIDYHRRRGAIDEWRGRLTRRQIERVNAAVPDEFWGRFGWPP